METLEGHNSTVDFIVVGAGVAGCVLAARLSEDPRHSVLLLEAGVDNSKEATEYVAGAASTWSGPLNWGCITQPQTGLAGRALPTPRGRTVGGSAAINAGSWSRGIAADYDAWEAAGATGWNWASALSTYRAIEHSDRARHLLRRYRTPTTAQPPNRRSDPKIASPDALPLSS